MKETFPGGVSRPVAADGVAEPFGRGVRRGLILAAEVGALALVAVALGLLVPRRGRAIDIPPHAYRTITGAGDAGAELRLRRPAPTEQADRDAGVAEAAREFAIELVTPSLKRRESSAFPPIAIRFERLDVLNAVTDGKIEHWLVDGVVHSKNDHGIAVPSQWRIVLGRSDDSFFPIIAALEGFAIYHLRSHPDLIREARQVTLQKRQAEAAAKKAQEAAEKSAVWQALEAAKPPEAKAQAALKLALNLLAAGRKEAAFRRLHEIIEQFPDTDAAAQARKLLEK
ncbi:MAG: tetratricopeptide repeat protein [Planctomycetaceae bacterium]